MTSRYVSLQMFESTIHSIHSVHLRWILCVPLRFLIYNYSEFPMA